MGNFCCVPSCFYTQSRQPDQTQTGQFDGELLVASWQGDYERCQELILSGANVNYIGYKYPGLALLNVNTDTNVLSSPLIAAASTGSLDIIMLLLDAGANVNLKASPTGHSALFVATVNGNIPAINILCDRGADVNLRAGKRKDTPLRIAVLSDRYGVIAALLAHGANHTLRDKGGRFIQCCLLDAVIQNSFPVVKLLLDHGADANGVNNDDWRRPLMVAVTQRNRQLAKLLLEHGADPNHKDASGQTALLIEAEYLGYSAEMIEELIQHLPEHVHDIKEYGDSTKMIELLLKHGADVNVKNRNGENALFVATERGKTKFVKMLMEAGSETNTVNAFGDIPLSVAAKINAFDIVKMLIPISSIEEIKKFGIALEPQIHQDDIFTEFERQLSDDSPDGWVSYSEFSTFLQKLKPHDAELLLYRLMLSCPFKPNAQETQGMIVMYIEQMENVQVMDDSSKEIVKRRMKSIRDNFDGFKVSRCNCEFCSREKRD